MNQYYQLTTLTPNEVLLLDNDYYSKESKGVDKSLVINDAKIETVFSVGDACVTLQNEEKNIPSLQVATETVANNFKRLAKDPYAKLEKMPLVPCRVGGVPFNSEGGVFVMNDMAMAKPNMDEEKEGYRSGLANYLEGKEGGADGYTAALAGNRGFFKSLIFTKGRCGRTKLVESSISESSREAFKNFVQNRFFK